VLGEHEDLDVGRERRQTARGRAVLEFVAPLGEPAGPRPRSWRRARAARRRSVVAANCMQRYELRHPNAKTVDSERRALEWTLPPLGDVPVDEVDVASPIATSPPSSTSAPTCRPPAPPGTR